MQQEAVLDQITLQGYLQRLVRQDQRGLTSGAYGDEGGILREVEDCLCRAQDDALGANFWSRLAKPAEAMASYTLDTVEALVAEVIVAWVPLRSQFTSEMTSQVMVATMGAFLDHDHRLRLEGQGGGPRASLPLEDWLLERLAAREVIQLERGGPDWLLLRDLDLLATLGTFVVEG